LAAEQDHSKAQANLGWLYINGAGVEEDLDEAEKWYKRSESLGEYPKKKDRN
jgi:TPR repeat protein